MDYIHDLRKEIGPRKIILNCAGALIIRDGRILFQRRTDNGRWGLIGGLLEMNETYQQAALREGPGWKSGWTISWGSSTITIWSGATGTRRM